MNIANYVLLVTAGIWNELTEKELKKNATEL